jgi:hypothetical protein
MPPSTPRWGAVGLILALATAAAVVLAGGRADQPRDIYYLVFDRYAGLETLQRYGFDNRPFLDAIRSRGFEVAEGARANYPKTAHSLAASLNMTYLDFLEDARHAPDDWGPVYGLMSGSRVATFLQERGYEYVHLGSWWGPTAEDPAADLNLAPRLRIEDAGTHRAAALFQLEELQKLAARPGPTFVFAHVLLPHPPYVFDREGNDLPAEVAVTRSRVTNYLEQLRYTNRRILETVDLLLQGPPETDPIILLQSDEGPHPLPYEFDRLYDWTEAPDLELQEKLGILSAYHLPGVRGAVYPYMSPVNSFRLILSRYFGERLALLPDRSYVFRDEEHLYQFWDVTDRVRSRLP